MDAIIDRISKIISMSFSKANRTLSSARNLTFLRTLSQSEYTVITFPLIFQTLSIIRRIVNCAIIARPSAIQYQDDNLYEAYEALYDNEKVEPVPDVDEYPDYDTLLDAEVLLPKDGEYTQAARVIGRAKDA